VNKLKAEKLINCENPEFGRLIRRMTGDDKTVVVKLIKITREQLREHMLRVILHCKNSFITFQQ